jgi:phage gpG-like protein
MGQGRILTLLNSQEFIAKCRAAIEQCGDMRPVWVSIARMWYKDNAQLFDKQGPGFYEDYKGDRDETPRSAYMSRRAKLREGAPTGMTRYMRFKQRMTGRVYPMMYFYGALSNSILSPGADGAVCIIDKTMLILGTNIDYAIYSQLGGPKIPYRPVIINKNVKGNQTEIFQNRVTNYSRLIDAYTTRQVKKAFGK